MRRVRSNAYDIDSQRMSPQDLRKFYTSDRWLSSYSLACGYVEVWESNGLRTTLWEEGGCYHVRQHDHIENRRITWEAFDRMSDARRYFQRMTY